MNANLAARRGCVYIVGAGPGDPGLLTLRGAELIRQATIIYYDRLAPEEILDLAAPAARLVNVGKGPTAGGESQRRINDLLVTSAREGHIVVRLKGGDPFVFGRGGEEALACAEAGVPFEIVPGVTSAIAAPACAGIPVTHRGVSSSVAIVTGHGADDNEPDIDWESLARGAGTLVVLMGVGRLEPIARRLMEAGRAPDTPVALVHNGSLPDQETLVSTLGEVAGEARRRAFASPAVFVVGECVGLRDRLAWMEKRPLFGLRVAVTRPAGEAEDLNGRLLAAGARVFHCPTIRIEPLAASDSLLEAVERAGSSDWLILTSVNGVRCFFRALERAGKDARALGGARIAAIGSKTAAELRKHGLRADIVPQEFSQEGVLDAILNAAGEVSGSRIMIARASAARELLPRMLEARGASVEVVPLYETIADEEGIARLKALMASHAVDAITFTSASTAQTLLAAIPEADRATLFRGCKTASIGPATSDALRAAGLRVDMQAKVYTALGLFEAMIENLAPGRGAL